MPAGNSPPDADIAAGFAAGRPQLLVSRTVADLETAVSAKLKLKRLGGGPSFLLESVEGGASRGRYSMIGLLPDLVWRCRDGKAEINRAFQTDMEAFTAEDAPPLESLSRLVKDCRFPCPDDLPPMAAGLFGYLGYDMVREMERLPAPKPDKIGMADAVLIRPTVMVVFDAVKDELVIVTPLWPKAGVTATQALETARERIDGVLACLDQPLEPSLRAAASDEPLLSPVTNTPPEDFAAMVARAKDYIVAGDIFQVVLAQRFSRPFSLGGFALYRALRRINPSPYLCYLDFGDAAFGGLEIVCSSPEILVKAQGGTVTIRPIAGTRPRGADRAEDIRLEAELLADEKERAEHLMLLDLGRNDVGRVAEIGSVKVTDSYFVERYSHVMHIVSNVEGKLRPELDALDALAAGFPAGTVSGAPKVRAMEIIDELERDRRGIYAGCIGYFGADGSMDTCIVLRTAVVKDGVMHVTAGAGVVHDSNPEAERQECVNKSMALFRAAEEAARFAASAKRGQ
ncbi:MAG: anthranilate synthase component I [Beijerinckiaceae bacterium]